MGTKGWTSQEVAQSFHLRKVYSLFLAKTRMLSLSFSLLSSPCSLQSSSNTPHITLSEFILKPFLHSHSALWEDEETRQFYEGITDIKPFVPAILLEERKKTASESTDDEEAKPSEQTEEAVDDDKLLEEMIKEADEGTGLDEEVEEDVISEEARDTEGDMPSEPPEAEGEVTDPSSQGAQFERFGLLLPTMLNRKLVDDLAVEFCMTLNSKGNRKKLAWTLFAVEKNRVDLIPFYARLVATLSPCVDDVVPTLLDMLLGVLRHQIRKRKPFSSLIPRLAASDISQ